MRYLRSETSLLLRVTRISVKLISVTLGNLRLPRTPGLLRRPSIPCAADVRAYALKLFPMFFNAQECPLPKRHPP
jgi:hypothetical protein